MSGPEWTCSVCTLVNVDMLTRCEACDSPKSIPKNPRNGSIPATTVAASVQHESKWTCEICTFVNETGYKCHMCESSKPTATAKTIHVPKIVSTPPTIKPDEKKANQTKQINQSGNLLAASTDSLRGSGDSLRSSGESEYSLSDSRVIDTDMEDELFFGDGSVEADPTQRVFDGLYQNIDPERNPNEIDKDIAFLPPPHELEAINILTPMQVKAMKYVVDKSKKESEAVYPQVLNRLTKMGYTENNLKRALRYIRDEAPIIVHLFLDRVLGFLVSDTHYRNQFETKRSGGALDENARISWEDRLFGSVYHQSSGYDRVKYGVLNIVNDPQGVSACTSSYGDSYLILKKVRLRTTFASKDTSISDVKLSCCEYYTHVLHDYNDDELRAVVNIAISLDTNPMASSSSRVISQYKEVQIHGPVELSKHVEAVVVNKRHRNDKNLQEQLEKFAKKNNCNIIWME